MHFFKISIIALLFTRSCFIYANVENREINNCVKRALSRYVGADQSETSKGIILNRSASFNDEGFSKSFTRLMDVGREGAEEDFNAVRRMLISLKSFEKVLVLSDLHRLFNKGPDQFILNLESFLNTNEITMLKYRGVNLAGIDPLYADSLRAYRKGDLVATEAYNLATNGSRRAGFMTHDELIENLEQKGVKGLNLAVTYSAYIKEAFEKFYKTEHSTFKKELKENILVFLNHISTSRKKIEITLGVIGEEKILKMMNYAELGDEFPHVKEILLDGVQKVKDRAVFRSGYSYLNRHNEGKIIREIDLSPEEIIRLAGRIKNEDDIRLLSLDGLELRGDLMKIQFLNLYSQLSPSGNPFPDSLRPLLDDIAEKLKQQIGRGSALDDYIENEKIGASLRRELSSYLRLKEDFDYEKMIANGKNLEIYEMDNQGLVLALEKSIVDDLKNSFLGPEGNIVDPRLVSMRIASELMANILARKVRPEALLDRAFVVMDQIIEKIQKTYTTSGLREIVQNLDPEDPLYDFAIEFFEYPFQGHSSGIGFTHPRFSGRNSSQIANFFQEVNRQKRVTREVSEGVVLHDWGLKFYMLERYYNFSPRGRVPTSIKTVISDLKEHLETGEINSQLISLMEKTPPEHKVFKKLGISKAVALRKTAKAESLISLSDMSKKEIAELFSNNSRDLSYIAVKDKDGDILTGDSAVLAATIQYSKLHLKGKMHYVIDLAGRFINELLEQDALSPQFIRMISELDEEDRVFSYSYLGISKDRFVTETKKRLTAISADPVSEVGSIAPVGGEHALSLNLLGKDEIKEIFSSGRELDSFFVKNEIGVEYRGDAALFLIVKKRLGMNLRGQRPKGMNEKITILEQRVRDGTASDSLISLIRDTPSDHKIFEKTSISRRQENPVQERSEGSVPSIRRALPYRSQVVIKKQDLELDTLSSDEVYKRLSGYLAGRPLSSLLVNEELVDGDILALELVKKLKTSALKESDELVEKVTEKLSLRMSEQGVEGKLLLYVNGRSGTDSVSGVLLRRYQTLSDTSSDSYTASSKGSSVSRVFERVESKIRDGVSNLQREVFTISEFALERFQKLLPRNRFEKVVDIFSSYDFEKMSISSREKIFSEFLESTGHLFHQDISEAIILFKDEIFEAFSEGDAAIKQIFREIYDFASVEKGKIKRDLRAEWISQRLGLARRLEDEFTRINFRELFLELEAFTPGQGVIIKDWLSSEVTRLVNLLQKQTDSPSVRREFVELLEAIAESVDIKITKNFIEEEVDLLFTKGDEFGLREILGIITGKERSTRAKSRLETLKERNYFNRGHSARDIVSTSPKKLTPEYQQVLALDADYLPFLLEDQGLVNLILQFDDMPTSLLRYLVKMELEESTFQFNPLLDELSEMGIIDETLMASIRLDDEFKTFLTSHSEYNIEFSSAENRASRRVLNLVDLLYSKSDVKPLAFQQNLKRQVEIRGVNGDSSSGTFSLLSEAEVLAYSHRLLDGEDEARSIFESIGPLMTQENMGRLLRVFSLSDFANGENLKKSSLSKRRAKLTRFLSALENLSGPERERILSIVTSLDDSEKIGAFKNDSSKSWKFFTRLALYKSDLDADEVVEEVSRRFNAYRFLDNTDNDFKVSMDDPGFAENIENTYESMLPYFEWLQQKSVDLDKGRYKSLRDQSFREIHRQYHFIKETRVGQRILSRGDGKWKALSVLSSIAEFDVVDDIALTILRLAVDNDEFSVREFYSMIRMQSLERVSVDNRYQLSDQLLQGMLRRTSKPRNYPSLFSGDGNDFIHSQTVSGNSMLSFNQGIYSLKLSSYSLFHFFHRHTINGFNFLPGNQKKSATLIPSIGDGNDSLKVATSQLLLSISEALKADPSAVYTRTSNAVKFRNSYGFSPREDFHWGAIFINTDFNSVASLSPMGRRNRGGKSFSFNLDLDQSCRTIKWMLDPSRVDEFRWRFEVNPSEEGRAYNFHPSAQQEIAAGRAPNCVGINASFIRGRLGR